MLPLEIHERCLRHTKNDQLWEAHAEAPCTRCKATPESGHCPECQGVVGPTVQSYSRKSVRGEADAAFNSDLVGNRRSADW